MLIYAWEILHILDLEIGKVVHDLDFVVRAAGYDFPKPWLVGKTPDLLYLEIRKVVDHLDFIVGETPYELDTTVDF